MNLTSIIHIYVKYELVVTFSKSSTFSIKTVKKGVGLKLDNIRQASLGVNVSY